MKNCPFCNAENDNNATFCGQCGKSFGRIIKCSKCGFGNTQGNDSEILFCGNCGNPIGQKPLKTKKYELKEKTVPAESLPEKVVIGYKDKNTPCYLNVRKNGNIVINVDSGRSSDQNISKFISFICLSLYEAFPPGALRINFFVGDIDDVYFSKFRFSQEKEDVQPVKVYKGNYSELDKYLENKCEELLYGKLTGNIKTFYELYGIDTTENFDYVIIRSGFSGLSASKTSPFVSKICSAFDIKNNSAYHRCGIRYIIVNDCNGTDQWNDFNKKSEFSIDFKNDAFYVQECPFYEIGAESENFEGFIEKKCAGIGGLIGKASRQVVSCEDVGFGSKQSGKSFDSVISIPVGKCGSEVTEISFSCGDMDGTSAGRNIGLMVIGQSRTGKSSLYNSIIVNGSHKYSPDALNFWLLDFKKNSTAGIYSNEKICIPHVKMAAPESKISDGYSILRLLCEEMDRRYVLFEELGSENVKISNIAGYNKVVSEKKGKGDILPRIVLMIDEAQELFRDESNGSDVGDYSKDISNLVSKISSKGAAAGIHIAMFAQNLDSQRTHLLKDNFLNQIDCKICFRLRASSVSNSGFGNEYTGRKEEIENLNTGTMYFPGNGGKLCKTKVAFIDDNSFKKYFSQINARYDNKKKELLKIGLTEKLNPFTKIVNFSDSYIDCVMQPSSKDNSLSCAVGEDAYRLRPVCLQFSDSNRVGSSVIIMGNGNEISNSLLTSLLLALRKNKCIVCDGTPRTTKSPFKNYSNILNVEKYAVSSIDDCIRNVYSSYLERIAKYSEDGDFIASPLFLFLNDFDMQEQISNNVSLRQKNDFSNNADAFAGMTSLLEEQEKKAPKTTKSRFDVDIRIRDAIGKLLDDGSKYNIFLIVTLKDVYMREFERAIGSSPNVVIFNDFKYATQYSNYRLKTILREMKQSGTNADSRESFAVLARGDEYYKFRPVIYSMKGDEIEKINKMIER